MSKIYSGHIQNASSPSTRAQANPVAAEQMRSLAERIEVRAGKLPEELGRRIEVWAESHHLPRLIGGLAGAYVLWRLVLPEADNQLPAPPSPANSTTEEPQ
jgi:hypothetical protein